MGYLDNILVTKRNRLDQIVTIGTIYNTNMNEAHIYLGGASSARLQRSGGSLQNQSFLLVVEGFSAVAQGLTMPKFGRDTEFPCFFHQIP